MSNPDAPTPGVPEAVPPAPANPAQPVESQPPATPTPGGLAIARVPEPGPAFSLLPMLQAMGRLPTAIPNQAVANSLLDVMVDGKEFESILNCSFTAVDLRAEIRRSIAEI